MNKKIGIFAIVMLLLGAGSSIALQSLAQTSSVPTQLSATVSTQTDQTIDQKDANGNDLENNDDSNVATDQKDANGNDVETSDDSKSSLGSEKEGVNDNDSDAKSEQGEKDGGQADTAGRNE